MSSRFSRRCRRLDKSLPPFFAVGGDELSRGRRGSGALVGNKVGNGEIDLMPDTRHQRDRATINRAREHFLVESPEVFQRAAPTRQDEHVALRAFSREVNHAGDLLTRSLTLDRYRIDDYRYGGKANARARSECLARPRRWGK